ncbi:hypothetical protein Phi19:1_gp010 [Cellulophaga phage phi19:1]|uniref:Uncharacterized protein n=1 Tax=Cellulophaga phage phi19:1 TaxID=1327970 RepID=R9ZXP7_9CAUD|nr:hypothetical protein Phi19:1_gp010 [Cellulophaga phage phi19:1]AGO47300.1 hypothetical protein Phi19:1_gp010 [Cellulophaga phage phi19:1]
MNEKALKDLINWLKSDLAQEESGKLSKTNTPYRQEKLRILRKSLDILNKTT